MRLLYVPLTDDALRRLRETAEDARRRPQDQAAVLLERALGLRPAAEAAAILPAEPEREPQPAA